MPSPSSTVIGLSEETVSLFCPFASRTRIEVAVVWPSVVPGVVGGEDLLVRVALERVALSAPLPHADAVPVAVAADEEERPGAGRRDVLPGRTSAPRAAPRRAATAASEGGEGDESVRTQDAALRVASSPSGRPVDFGHDVCEAT